MKPDWLIKLNELTEEHPDAEVVCMVAIEDIYCDFPRYATHDVSVGLTKYALYGECMIEDEDDLFDRVEDAIYSKEIHGSMTNAEFEKLVEAELKKYTWTKAIYVDIG